jgi:hypothetical protein
MSKLSYICNTSNIQRLHEETTKKNGVYFFIRKNGEKGYNSYRKVETGSETFYYVQVGLPPEVFKDLIKTGKMDKIMNG